MTCAHPHMYGRISSSLLSWEAEQQNSLSSPHVYQGSLGSFGWSQQMSSPQDTTEQPQIHGLHQHWSDDDDLHVEQKLRLPHGAEIAFLPEEQEEQHFVESTSFDFIAPFIPRCFHSTFLLFVQISPQTGLNYSRYKAAKQDYFHSLPLYQEARRNVNLQDKVLASKQQPVKRDEWAETMSC